jgi:hypothetical protein
MPLAMWAVVAGLVLGTHVAAAASCGCDLAKCWRVCVANGDAACAEDAHWPSPPLPTTALLALLAGPNSASLFTSAPALRGNETEVDLYFGDNLLRVRDVNGTGRAFYTLRWERRLDGCAGRLLELPGINYRATVSPPEPEAGDLPRSVGLFCVSRSYASKGKHPHLETLKREGLPATDL